MTIIPPQRVEAFPQDVAVLLLAPVVQDHREQDGVVPGGVRGVSEEVAGRRPDAIREPRLRHLARGDLGHVRQVVHRRAQTPVALAELQEYPFLVAQPPQESAAHP